MSILRHLLCLTLLACTLTAMTVSAAGSSSLPVVKSGSFIHTEVDRTIDLKTHIEEVTVQIKAKNTGSSATSNYIVAIPASKAPRLAFFEGSVGKTKLISRQVTLSSATGSSAGDSFFQIDLPKSIGAGESISFQVFLVFTRTQRPFPEEIEQSDNQLVMYEDSAIFYSPYQTESDETLIKLASKQVESYTKKNGKKSSDDIRYGPFSDVSPYDSSRPIAIHFVNNSPFVTFNSLSKDIEVSHWGNVAVQDNYILTHTGAKLRGEFTRSDYERSRNGESAPASFRTLIAELPRTAKDIYYRDCIGNVSTSHVRRARDFTRMEIDPRFPMFGGWTSDFHIGYNLPSQHYLSYDPKEDDHYILNITFASPIASSAIDELEVRVILPEGAESIEWRTPFDIDSAEFTEFKTYLDTTGRPTLILRKSNCVSRHHQQFFQVSYRFSKASILREPFLIAAATFLCLALVIAFTHADLRITDEGNSAAVVRPSPISTTRTGTPLGESIQNILENFLAEPNGLLSVAQDRQPEKFNLVNSLVKEITIALKEVEKEDSATFANIVASLTGSLPTLVKASKRYVNATTGNDVAQAREQLGEIVDTIRQQAEKLAAL